MLFSLLFLQKTHLPNHETGIEDPCDHIGQSIENDHVRQHKQKEKDASPRQMRQNHSLRSRKGVADDRRQYLIPQFCQTALKDQTKQANQKQKDHP